MVRDRKQNEARETGDRTNVRHSEFCRPLRGLEIKKQFAYPALKRWATFVRPLCGRFFYP